MCTLRVSAHCHYGCLCDDGWCHSVWWRLVPPPLALYKEEKHCHLLILSHPPLLQARATCPSATQWAGLSRGRGGGTPPLPLLSPAHGTRRPADRPPGGPTHQSPGETPGRCISVTGNLKQTLYCWLSTWFVNCLPGGCSCPARARAHQHVSATVYAECYYTA